MIKLRTKGYYYFQLVEMQRYMIINYKVSLYPNDASIKKATICDCSINILFRATFVRAIHIHVQDRYICTGQRVFLRGRFSATCKKCRGH